jgi:hypothetical protein
VTLAALRRVLRARFAPAQDDIFRKTITRSSLALTLCKGPLRAHSVFFNFDCDLRRVEERVVDEAVVDGAFDTGAVLVG